MTRFKIHPTVILAAFFPFLGILTWGQTGLLWLCALLHEAAHIAAYRICGTKMQTVEILPFGICAIPENSLKITPSNEIFCAAAGPAVNLLLTALLLACPFSAENETARYLLYCNGALFFINILPILPLDGGRILYYALAKKHDAALCEKICYRCAVVLLLLLLYPVCAALFGENNPSLAMIWGYLMGITLLRRGSI
ncbi:MAG: site-2 protease family protein [Clostridia bacterium]|nr:site-2 protease family protein [Clostridia bacterium]